MNTNDFNKGIQDIKKIHLSAHEKKVMLQQVMNTPIASSYTPTKTWWNFTYQRFAYVGAFLVIFMLTGGVLVYADQGTVPGDLLYPVKRDITEPIHALLAVTPTAKTAWAATVANRRLSEVETLAEKNKLTPQYSNDLEKDFNTSVADFDDDLQSVATTTHNEQDLAFHASMQKHSDILHAIGIDKGDGEQAQIQQFEQKIPRIATTTDMHFFRKGAASTSEKFTHSTSSPQRNSRDGDLQNNDTVHQDPSEKDR